MNLMKSAYASVIKKLSMTSMNNLRKQINRNQSNVTQFEYIVLVSTSVVSYLYTVHA